jgi:hypothetical protein
MMNIVFRLDTRIFVRVSTTRTNGTRKKRKSAPVYFSLGKHRVIREKKTETQNCVIVLNLHGRRKPEASRVQ